MHGEDRGEFGEDPSEPNSLFTAVGPIPVMGFGKDGKGVIITESRSQVLTTLGNDVVIFIGTKLAMTDDFRMLKLETRAFIDGITDGEQLGLYYGICDGDLSTGEVSAQLDASGPLDANDIVTGNTAMRPVWILGACRGHSATTGIIVGEGNSPLMTKNPRWTFSATKSWNFFIWNKRGGALTTGATVRQSAKSFGVWVR